MNFIRYLQSGLVTPHFNEMKTTHKHNKKNITTIDSHSFGYNHICINICCYALLCDTFFSLILLLVRLQIYSLRVNNIINNQSGICTILFQYRITKRTFFPHFQCKAFVLQLIICVRVLTVWVFKDKAKIFTLLLCQGCKPFHLMIYHVGVLFGYIFSNNKSDIERNKFLRLDRDQSHIDRQILLIND